MEPVAFDDIPLEIFLEDIMDLTRPAPLQHRQGHNGTGWYSVGAAHARVFSRR